MVWLKYEPALNQRYSGADIYWTDCPMIINSTPVNPIRLTWSIVRCSGIYSGRKNIPCPVILPLADTVYHHGECQLFPPQPHWRSIKRMATGTNPDLDHWWPNVISWLIKMDDAVMISIAGAKMCYDIMGRLTFLSTRFNIRNAGLRCGAMVRWLPACNTGAPSGIQFSKTNVSFCSLVNIQYCGEPPWLRDSTLGLRPSGLRFRILCLDGSVIWYISASSGV